MRNLLPASLLFFVVVALPASAALSIGPVIPGGLSLPVIADADGNGLDDLIQGRSVLLNFGNGTFVTRDLALEGSDQVVDRIDVNGDGRVDLFTESRPVNTPGLGGADGRSFTAVYVARGDLQYERVSVAVPERFRAYIADADGDAKDDLVLTKALFEGIHAYASEVRVMVSRGDGTFESRASFLVPPEPQLWRSRRMLAGDVDRDGIQDLVIRTTDELVFVRGIGHGAFDSPRTYYVPSQPFGVVTTALADADGDGNLDVLMGGSRTLRIFFGDGSGAFPRLISAYLPLLRHVAMPSFAYGSTSYFEGQEPRNILVGSFIDARRIEIALGTGEGDIVVLTVENGRLHEVSRTPTEFRLPDLHAGAFRHSRTDLYVTWNLGYPAGRPASRLIYADPAGASVKLAAPPLGRLRSVRKSSTPPAPARLTMRATGDCVPADAAAIEFIAGGTVPMQMDSERVDAIVDADGKLYFRMFAAWSSFRIEDDLRPVEGGYEGTASALTACGWRLINLTASN